MKNRSLLVAVFLLLSLLTLAPVFVPSMRHQLLVSSIGAARTFAPARSDAESKPASLRSGLNAREQDR
jgi:hypothetical protein